LWKSKRVFPQFFHNLKVYKRLIQNEVVWFFHIFHSLEDEADEGRKCEWKAKPDVDQNQAQNYPEYCSWGLTDAMKRLVQFHE
jgi:hypothetical protein